MESIALPFCINAKTWLPGSSETVTMPICDGEHNTHACTFFSGKPGLVDGTFKISRFLCEVLWAACPSWCRPAEIHTGLHIFYIHYDSWRGRGVTPFCINSSCSQSTPHLRIQVNMTQFRYSCDMVKDWKLCITTANRCQQNVTQITAMHRWQSGSVRRNQVESTNRTTLHAKHCLATAIWHILEQLRDYRLQPW